MRITKLLMLPLLGAGICFNTSVLAQKAKKEAPSRQPWIVNCASNGAAVNCATTQKVLYGKRRQLLLDVTIRGAPKTKDAVMRLQLPHGLHLPAGIKLKVDGANEVKEQIQTCFVQGCFAGMKIPASFLKKMQAGKQISVTFTNQAKKDITVNIPLKGFPEAYNKIKS